MRYYLAIDIGASSGRHIIGWRENGAIHTKEIYRFPNSMYEEDGHLVWDMPLIFSHVVRGIAEAFKAYSRIESLSIDTWGVDYVLLKDCEEVLPVYAYRDGRTKEAITQAHEIMPFSMLYRQTGCQFQTFNTVYQLYDDKVRGRLSDATDMLMIPEYLMWMLTGIKAREYTNATTTGMVNAQTGEFDREIVEELGFPLRLFPKLSQPGTVLGDLLPDIVQTVGGNCKVVLCATHDTASAVEGIPMVGNYPYLSSGTWSLLGLKTPKHITDPKSMSANFSNEGGVGYNRFQKNIMGMWIVNRLQRELCPDLPYEEIVKLAEASTCRKILDVNGEEFVAPQSMKAVFDNLSGNILTTVGDYFRCAYDSLAACYHKAIRELETIMSTEYDTLYIVGGGAKNTFLNRLTEEVTGKRVIALPIEATALGNLKIQMEVD